MKKTLASFKQLNKIHDGHFFDKGAMSFFNSRIESNLINENYFITSERMTLDMPKKYTVRGCNWEDGNVETIDSFNSYDSLEDAKNAVKAL